MGPEFLDYASDETGIRKTLLGFPRAFHTLGHRLYMLLAQASPQVGYLMDRKLRASVGLHVRVSFGKLCCKVSRIDPIS